MKKLLMLSCLILATSLMFMSCEGPEGPPGEDGIAVCSECHDNSQLIVAKEVQYNASVHATGGNFERNEADCAVCHTSQGFRESLLTGEMEATADVTDPLPPNCYTCHNIHETYTEEDWELTKTDAADLWIADATVDMGKANLCASCHQPRVPDPMPTIGGPDVTISSAYWGPHHGPQAALIAGMGAFEVSGSATYENSAHTSMITDGCVTCHMADAFGNQAGGHQMGMSYNYHGGDHLNTAGCTSCHTDLDALDTKVETTKTEIEGLLTTLHDALVNEGVLNNSTGRINAGTWTATQAGAYINYVLVEEDRSGGVHNYKYIKALLENTIAAL